MSLIENLYSINSIKADIKSAIEAKGVDMTGMSFADFPGAVSQIQGEGYTDKDITERGFNITALNNSASFVGSFAFYRYLPLETVSLPSCTGVNENAFNGCSFLTSVNLPVCLDVWMSAFTNCTSLTNVSLPVCRYIGPNGFYGCSLLQSIDLPECSYIGAYAFTYCSSLEQINIPMVESIDNYTFRYCSSLQALDLPECKDFKGNAAAGCSSLAGVNLPKCSHIGAGAFNGCSSLEQISIPMVESIDGTSTFFGAVISTISLPRCENIGPNVFTNCSLLSEVYVGMEAYSVTKLGNNVFTYTPIASGTGSIYVRSDLYDQYVVANNWSVYASQIVSVPVSSPLLSFSNGALTGDTTYIKDNIYSVFNIVARNDILTVSLPECSYVYTSAFDNCQMLSEVYIPSCEYIGDYAFRNFGRSATSDIEITLPVCSYIGKGAFNQANHLTKLTLGSNSVCQLAQDTGAFYSSPVSIYVPASLYDAYLADVAWAFWSAQIFSIQ